MTDVSFVDLEIRIQQKLPEGYPVEITLGGQQEFPRGFLAADVLPWYSSGDLAADGQRLFKILLSDAALREAWGQARGQAPQRRIRLRIDPTAAELHALPWELLHDGISPLAAHADTPFSRYLPVALPWGSATVQRPVKALIVIANPSDLYSKYDLPHLDVALEEETLQAAFAVIDSSQLQIDFLDAPITLAHLEEKLRQGYHWLHFLGHGAFNVKRGQAALYLENENQQAHRVTDEEFAGMLARQGVQPLMVFLAACQSATRSTVDAYQGLAPKLVAAGVPAVVAMQDTVTVKTARQFSATLYGQLLEHGQIDLAVNEARSTLITAGRLDAKAPVLFMRLKSGRLWSEELTAATSSFTLPLLKPDRPPIVRPFIGRETELERYQQQLEICHLVIISGMPGIGKTVLAAELAQRNEETHPVFWHTFQAAEGLTAILQKLADFLAWHDQPAMKRVISAAGQTVSARQLLDYVIQVLRDRAAMICLDNVFLNEDDPWIKLLIDRLRELAATGPLRLIITTQEAPDFVDGDEYPPLAGLTLADTRAFLIQHGLSVTDAGENHIAEVRDTQALRRTKVLLSEDIVATVHARTGGNPMFLILAADGLKRTQYTGVYLAQLFEDRDIRRFLIHQIDRRLTEPERSVMQSLSVMLGYGATRTALDAASAASTSRRILDELCDRHLVTAQETETEWEYSLNTIVRTFYYDELDPRERQIRHMRAAEYYSQSESDRFQAALHYEAAGQFDRAASLVVDHVNEVIAHGQGYGLSQLLEHFTADRLPPDLWARVNLARGEVYTVQGHSETARQSFQSALMLLNTMYSTTRFKSDLALSPEIRRLYARAYLGIGSLLESEDPPEALKWLQRGLDALAGSEAAFAAILWIRLGSVQVGMGNYAEAQRSTERGLRDLNNWLDHWRAVGLMNLGIIFWKRNDYQRATEFYQHALTIYEELQDYWGVIPLQLDRGIDLDRVGQWPQAVACFQDALNQAKRLGMVRYEATLELALGVIHTKRGSDEVAQAHLLRCIALAREHTLNEVLVAGLSSLSDWYIRRQEWSAAESVIAEAEALALDMDAKGQLPELWRGIAQINLARWQLDQACATIEKTIDLCRDLELKIDEGMCWRILGQVFTARGQLDQAGDAFRHSLELVYDDSYEVARLQAEWGHALLETDHEHASSLLREARATFEHLGAQRDLAASSLV
ncbi:MAG TPA: CHAT domain-containing protein [Anaerolineae bacterium]|nr:CHAT domain-containing protein [Anaerolineae bacterium]